MQHIIGGYRGLSLLLNLNMDLIVYISTIGVALLAGAFIGSF